MALSLDWVAHACFRLSTPDQPVVVLDPYSPAAMNLADVRIDADVVVRSSATDMAHAYAGLVTGRPRLVDALQVARGGKVLVGEAQLIAVETREADHHPDGSGENAIYALRLGGLWIMHLGDVGHPLTDDHLAPFRDRSDVLLAPTGGGLTIGLEALDEVIQRLAPTWIVPMHFGLPGLPGDMLSVTAFLERRRGDVVIDLPTHVITLSPGSRPSCKPTIVVLKPRAYELRDACPTES